MTGREVSGESAAAARESAAVSKENASVLSPEKLMREALRLAEEAAREGEVPVGAVVARDGVILGRGRNRREADRNALAHAELEAIDQACRTLGGWRLFGCELYVTLEPCPMCAGAIINARLDRVVYGAADPKAGSCGSVIDLFALPYNHHPLREGGLLREECAAQLTGFFRSLRATRDKRRTSPERPDGEAALESK